MIRRGIERRAGVPALLALCVLLCGCAASGTRPDWEQVRGSAHGAVTRPAVWIPLVGAGLLALGKGDHSVSDWAVDHQPLFGSRSRAGDASDAGLAALIAAAAVSSLAVPQDRNADRVRALAHDGTILVANHYTSAGLKSAVGRSRPIGTGDDSFPSRHASDAFTAAAIVSRNLARLDWSERRRTVGRIAIMTLATVTAWARVEGGYHYSTDVLAGAALGSFTGQFLDRLFPGRGDELQVGFAPVPGAFVLSADFRFY